jgi:hypothetical protein
MTPMHVNVGILKLLIANIHGELQQVKFAAKQFNAIDRFGSMPLYVS